MVVVAPASSSVAVQRRRHALARQPVHVVVMEQCALAVTPRVFFRAYAHILVVAALCLVRVGASAHEESLKQDERHTYEERDVFVSLQMWFGVHGNARVRRDVGGAATRPWGLEVAAGVAAAFAAGFAVGRSARRTT